MALHALKPVDLNGPRDNPVTQLLCRFGTQSPAGCALYELPGALVRSGFALSAS